MPRAPKIFVSYSHKDAKYLDLLQGIMKPMVREGVIDLWADTRIASGDKWREEIEKALDDSDIAILLVSDYFLASAFIAKDELPPLLNKERVYWILVSHCLWDKTVLTQYQAANDTNHPLASLSLSDRKGVLTQVCRDLLRGIEARAGAVSARSNWNVPFPRNPFFTGRKDFLHDLHEALAATGSAAVSQTTSHAISGLGGVGKTQIAVEYAYRRRDEYKAVFWVTASDASMLSSGYSDIARCLDLPQKDLNDQQLVVDAVKRWLDSNEGWLLILDNADDPSVLPPFMPGEPKGRILFTSRAETLQEVGIPEPLKLEELPPDEALDFLLKRTGRKDLDDTRELQAAESLAKELEYLPLALEQAAAYIVEKRCKFAAYLKGYEQRRLKLLDSQKPLMGSYPKSVVTTWDANFQAVESASRAAADVLRLSAMLAPEPIPYEVLTEGAGELGPNVSKALASCSEDPLVLDELLSHLSRYSLIRRGDDGWSVHRLVQAVVRERMREDEERVWAERAVNAVSSATPRVEFVNWPLCERLLPHQQACAQQVERYGIQTQAAGRMLNQAGAYLSDMGRYAETEPLYRRALKICEKVLGPEQSDTALSLNNLAVLLDKRGDYAAAEPFIRRALEIREKVLGSEHPQTALSLNNLAVLLDHRADYDGAEPVYRRALEIREKVLGPDHPDTALSLNNLAVLLQERGDLVTAEPLLGRSLEIREKVLGPEHPHVAQSLDGLAVLLYARGDYAAAEPLLRRALAICEKSLGPEHPYTKICRYNLDILMLAKTRRR